MKLHVLLTAIMLSQSAASMAADQPDPVLPEWLKELPQLLEESSATTQIYLKNYLQCMDDQQALKSEPGQSLGQTLENALASSNACAPLLQELMQQLSREESTKSDQDTENSL